MCRSVSASTRAPARSSGKPSTGMLSGSALTCGNCSSRRRLISEMASVVIGWHGLPGCARIPAFSGSAPLWKRVRAPHRHHRWLRGHQAALGPPGCHRRADHRLSCPSRRRSAGPRLRAPSTQLAQVDADRHQRRLAPHRVHSHPRCPRHAEVAFGQHPEMLLAPPSLLQGLVVAATAQGVRPTSAPTCRLGIYLKSKSPLPRRVVPWGRGDAICPSTRRRARQFC